MMIQAGIHRALSFLIVATLAAAGCSTSTPYQQPFAAQPVVLGAGEELAVDRLIVLFDASGSIHPKKVFPGEKAWVESFVQGMPDGQYESTIRSFGGDDRRGAQLAPFNREGMAAGANGLELIGEDSPLDAVLLELADQLEDAGGRTAVVVVTDGIPNQPAYGGPAEPTLAAGRKLIEKSKGSVCYHTVLAGDEPGGRALLEALSALTDCGSFRLSSSVSDGASLASFERDVFVTAAAAPVVVAAAPGDADGDGVLDAADECPGTPIGAKVDERGCWVLEGVRFASNSADILPGAGAAIASVSAVLKQNPDLRIQIDGYTDSSGAAAYNQSLSERRAEAIRKELVADGIAATRLDAKGFGEENPIADNATRAGRAENRRIEFTVLR
jgi:OOP family OmpA-OmpF porin